MQVNRTIQSLPMEHYLRIMNMRNEMATETGRLNTTNWWNDLCQLDRDPTLIGESVFHDRIMNDLTVTYAQF